MEPIELGGFYVNEVGLGISAFILTSFSLFFLFICFCEGKEEEEFAKMD